LGLGRSIFFENKAWVVPWARPNAPARMPGCDSIALHFFPHGGGAIRNERESRNGQRGTRTSSVGAPTHWRVSSSLPPCASAHRSVRRRARDSQLPWRPAPFPLCVYAHAVQRSIASLSTAFTSSSRKRRRENRAFSRAFTSGRKEYAGKQSVAPTANAT
jgi:hypothetical protein